MSDLKTQTLSEALRIVKEHVALSPEQRRYPGTSYFICYAASKAYSRGRISRHNRDQIKRIVQKRLGRGCSALETWLGSRGIDLGPFEGDTYPLVQKHRHAWLDLLAKEFEQ